jgi:uncharacterized SAM-binding protein YcdF (DUF218 family)
LRYPGPKKLALTLGGGRTRNLLIAVLSLLLLGTAAYVGRAAISRQVGEFLVATDPVEKADILYLLNGDHKIRPYRAAQLFHAGMAPKIVIPWVKDSQIEPDGVIWNESELNRTALRMCGVPDSRVEEFHFMHGVTSTFDEARALQSYAQLHSVRKVIVVTSDWHSRRTRWIMRRLLSPNRIEVMVTGAAGPYVEGRSWARRNEYLKLFYYWLRYQMPMAGSPS